MRLTARSLIEPPGLTDSNFANRRTPCRAASLISTSGVLPIAASRPFFELKDSRFTVLSRGAETLVVNVAREIAAFRAIAALTIRLDFEFVKAHGQRVVVEQPS